MATQEVDFALEPAQIAARLAELPGCFALDGGTVDSWGCGRAIIGVLPRSTLHVFADGSAAIREGSATMRLQGEPLRLLEDFRTTTQPGHRVAPFSSGLLVALSYDLGDHLLPRCPRPARSRSLILYAARYDALLSYDYRRHRYLWGSAYSGAAACDAIAARVAEHNPFATTLSPLRVHSTTSRADYEAAVAAALHYIGAGDIYQVNLSQRFVSDGAASPIGLYLALQRQHPMPFSAYVDCGEVVLVSNSPECLLERDERTLATYPIKGTRARRTDPAADRRAALDLRNDPKELAEHVMIVDLERNDLGRVCDTGSIEVERFAHIESFPSLHHLVSKVSGRIAPDVTLAELLRATFPGGSITGAPKIRAMQIIQELEAVSRGFYTGSIGFVDDCGRTTFNIAIRTAVMTAQRATYHAGGGIVADSSPSREYEEILLKAQPFLSALHAKAA